MRRRRGHGDLLFFGAIALSMAVVHPVGVLIYETTRPPVTPLVMVHVGGEGTGIVTSVPDGLRCDGKCSHRYQVGDEILLTATVGEKSTFEGWSKACGEQSWRGFQWLQHKMLENATYEEVEAKEQLYTDLANLSARPKADYPLQCRVIVTDTTRVYASFGEMPDEVDVEWVQLPDEELEPEPEKIARNDEITISLPDPDFEARNIIKPEPMPDEMPIEPDPPAPVPVVPEPPPPEIPKPQPKPEVAQATPKQPQQAPKMKSVEVPDENEVEKAPDDAAFLSDKNRDVAEQTHAKQTNLERAAKGDAVVSEKSDITEGDVGAKEDEIAQMEDTTASDIDVEREDETAKTGEDDTAEGVVAGDEGESGKEGESGDDREADNKGVLAMRGIEGRGAPIGKADVKVDDGSGAPGEVGDGGKRGKRGKRGQRGIKTQIDSDDYKRIVGNDKFKEEQKIAARKKSKRQGRWERKFGAIKGSLENFTPEVKPGNQTALKTRAAPFAVYIARMHRRIHELWGFGFLEDLDDKPSSHPMNNWSLFTKIEIVINPDGTVDKMTIVKPSGLLTFDVAALDVIDTAGPYQPPPEKIRSADGKTYMHWAFHRDWRQCGTFGAEPFILTTPRRGGDKGVSDKNLLDSLPRRRKKGRKRLPPKATEGGPAATARAANTRPSDKDPAATHTANMWLTGFTKRDVGKLVKLSGVPFSSGDQVVANATADLKAVYANILGETRGRPLKTRLMTPARYRKTFGSLPAGVESKGTELFYVVKLRKEQFTLRLEKRGGEYKITGFYR